MNETLNMILSRRSIRKYTDVGVPNEIINTILEAGMNAPSGYNDQPWRFVVIRNHDILCELSTMHAGLDPLKAAPVVILVCGDTSDSKLDFYWQINCAAATQNILLAAHSLGFGGVWLGVDPRDKEDSKTIRELLRLPEKLKPFALLPIGVPAEIRVIENRFNKGMISYV